MTASLNDDRSITLHAPAKLNLALAVGAPAPPKGYHPIASWFVPIELFDDLKLTVLRDGSASEYDIAWHPPDRRFTVSPSHRLTPSRIDWPLEKDLAVRAHRMIEQHIGRALPLRLELRKRIPTGGGLGGGSSDAAAMLLGVDRLFELELSHAALTEMANRLGSDVAFFLDEGLVGGTDGTNGRDGTDGLRLVPRGGYVTGFGEVIERVPRVRTDVLLIFPPFWCPTAEVYRAFDAMPVDQSGVGGEGGVPRAAGVRTAIEHAMRVGHIDQRSLFNHLEPAAFSAVPAFTILVTRELQPALDSLAPRFGPLRAHMTGSGSTLFVIPDAQNAGMTEELGSRIVELVPRVRCLATRIV